MSALPRQRHSRSPTSMLTTNGYIQRDILYIYKEKLQLLKTEPGLTRLIIQILKTQDLHYTGTEKNEKWMRQLLIEQEQIGLYNFTRGFMMQTWGNIQEEYHRQENAQIISRAQSGPRQ